MALQWTEERIEQLKKLLSAETVLPYSLIAVTLGTTKGAVAGFVNRHLRIAFARRPGKLAFKAKRVRKPRMNTAKMIQIPAPIVVAPTEPLPLKVMWDTIDRGECAYIHGHPFDGNWLYCGHMTRPNSSYCQYHDSVTKMFKPLPVNHLDKVKQLSQE